MDSRLRLAAVGVAVGLALAGLLQVGSGLSEEGASVVAQQPADLAAAGGVARPESKQVQALAAPMGVGDTMRTGTSAPDGFDERWLQARHFVPGSTALARLQALADGEHLATTAAVPALRVLPPGREAGAAAPEVIVLSPHERMLKASVPVALLGQADGFLVRWINVSDQRVMQFAPHHADARGGDAVQVWLHNSSGWPPGDYRVEVITADTRLLPVAVSDFNLTSDPEWVTPLKRVNP